MIPHPIQLCENASNQDIETILDASFTVLESKGLIIQSSTAHKALADAGLRVNAQDQKVYFTRPVIEEALSLVPSQWILQARNHLKSVQFGGSSLAIAPGYGSVFIADEQGRRREATLNDFEKLSRLSYASALIDITGGLLVEPNDIQIALRPLEMTYALIRNSDKPYMGAVVKTDGAYDSIEMSRIVFGDLSNQYCVIGLININSPLRLDVTMANALIAYVQAGQPVLLTPGIMMGISAPVTFAGALVQAYAELMGCVTLVQVLRPGTPVIIGLGGFGSELRNGTTGFGRPENALAMQVGAQIARRLHIPFRCSAAVTSARQPDCQSGYERMMTALNAYHSGSHFCLQAAGILDSINTMSYEQFIIDLEIWSYIARLGQKMTVDSDALGLDIINFHSDNYLAHEHTIRYMREELFAPSLAPLEPYEQWLESDRKDIVIRARGIAEQILKATDMPELDAAVDNELKQYMKSRKKTLLGIP